MVGACESAYGCAYYNTISWRNETTPLPMENRPRAIFERLFGDAGTDPNVRLAFRREDRSILDAINSDVKGLRLRVGGTDRGKIDQYLEAIRDVERRIELAEKHGDRELPVVGSPVGAPEVSKALYGKNLKVEPEMVRLEGPIKECALYEVNLNLGYDVTTSVKVMVVPQKQ